VFELKRNMRMEYHGTMLLLMLVSVINQQGKEHATMLCLTLSSVSASAS